MKLGRLFLIIALAAVIAVAAGTDLLPWRLVRTSDLKRLQADMQGTRAEAQRLRAQLHATPTSLHDG